MTLLLYIGNFLHTSGKTPPPAELLLGELSPFYEIRRASNFSNPVLRLVHMLYVVFQGRFIGSRLVMVDVFSSKAFWYAVAVKEWAGILGLPVVLVLHGGQLPERFQSSPGVSARLLRGAVRVISPSGYLKRHAEKISGVKVQVIGNPLRLELYPLQPKSYAHLHLLWVRSFHEIYNPGMAIEVLKQLKNSDPAVKLTMIGPDKDGSMQRIRERTQKEGLTENIRILGFMSKEDWIKESEKANVFINTTTADNTPVSVLEALALGIPVISTKVGGIPDLLTHQENALLAESGDAEAMTRCILRLQEDPALPQKLIGNGRWLAEQMDLKEVVKQWKAMIEELLTSTS